MLIVSVEGQSQPLPDLTVGDQLLVDLGDGDRCSRIEPLSLIQRVEEELVELISGLLHSLHLGNRACLSTSLRSSSIGSEKEASSSSLSFQAVISGSVESRPRSVVLSSSTLQTAKASHCSSRGMASK